jgi:hypothetical protein
VLGGIAPRLDIRQPKKALRDIFISTVAIGLFEPHRNSGLVKHV